MATCAEVPSVRLEVGSSTHRWTHGLTPHHWVPWAPDLVRCSAGGADPGRLLPGQARREPVDQFIEALPAKRAAKIDDFVEEHQNGRPPEAPPPEFPITSQIKGDLRELRVRFANTRYRILYQRSGNLIVLLHAIEKDTGAVPKADKELAKRRMADFKRRMNATRRVPPRAAGKDASRRSR
jgi:phage-related protein